MIVQEGGTMQSTTASSVSEALATVTSKMTTGTAVLVSGTNLMLPMNFVKSGQQITVVSGGSKLLAAVPAVRTPGTTTMSNAFVLQSLLSQANKVMQQQKNQQCVVVQTTSGDNKNIAQHSGVITSNPQRIFSSFIKNDQKIVCMTSSASKINTADSCKTTFALALANLANQQEIKNSKVEVLKENENVREIEHEIKEEINDNAVDRQEHLVQKQQGEITEDISMSEIKAGKDTGEAHQIHFCACLTSHICDSSFFCTPINVFFVPSV